MVKFWRKRKEILNKRKISFCGVTGLPQKFMINAVISGVKAVAKISLFKPEILHNKMK